MTASGRHIANRYGRMALLVSVLLIQPLTVALGEEPPPWKSGSALDAQLKQAVGIRWEERPLRPALERLAQEFGAAVFLDRRLNPDRPITLAVSDLPLSQLYDRIADEANAAAYRIGSVTYIGPPATASRLPALANRQRAAAAQSPADLRPRLLKQSPCTWPEAIEPRQLVRELALEAGLSVEGVEAIPHDVWPAVQLSPLAWTDRLTLVLAGFDLTFEINSAAKSVRFVPMPAVSVADFSPRLANPTMSGKTGNEKRYSLRVAGEPIGNVLRTVAQSLGKELTYDPSLLDKLRQSVTFDLKNATLEQLLDATLDSAGLTYRLTDNELQVTAGP